MNDEIVKVSMLGGLGFFFVIIFSSFGYFIVGTGRNLPFEVALSTFVIFIIFVFIGLVMTFRSARLITGDGKRASQYFYTDNTEEEPSVPQVSETEGETK